MRRHPQFKLPRSTVLEVNLVVVLHLPYMRGSEFRHIDDDIYQQEQVNVQVRNLGQWRLRRHVFNVNNMHGPGEYAITHGFCK